MIHHAVQALIKRAAYAERRLTEIPTEQMQDASRAAMTAYWQAVQNECIDALNVLAAEQAHRELKRKGIR